jgi:hypothetical protein
LPWRGLRVWINIGRRHIGVLIGIIRSECIILRRQLSRRRGRWWNIDNFLLLLLFQYKAILLEVTNPFRIDNSPQDIPIAQIPSKIIDIITYAVPNLPVILLTACNIEQHRIAKLHLRNGIRIGLIQIIFLLLHEDVALAWLFEEQPDVPPQSLH